MVARKLIKKQLGEEKNEEIENIVSFLCSDSGSHDYATYRNEAKDELKLNIEKPNDEHYTKIKEIYEVIAMNLN